MSKTSIEWTEETWNPVTGCSKISPGCKHCYAEVMATRLKAMGQANYRNGFKVTLQPHMLAIPLKRRKPTMWFVNSMSDLFHEQVPQEYVAAVFGVMGTCQRHTFQVLTKRPERMRQIFESWNAWNGPENASQACWDEAATVYDLKTRRAVDDRWALDTPWPLPNVWLGVSVEDRKYGLPRIDELRATPAAVRFLSVEPLLEDLGTIDLTGIDWVIVGGESGLGARPMHPEWVRNIRDQVFSLRQPCPHHGEPAETRYFCAKCHGHGTTGPRFFFKQWGEWVPRDHTEHPPRGSNWGVLERDGNYIETATTWTEEPNGGVAIRLVGKGKAGRELDGRTWDEMPRRRA